MRKEVFVVFIVLLFGLMVFSIDAEVEVEYIFGEFIGNGECGDVAGYELVGSFVDGRGLAFNHCASRKEYVEDLSFVVESYFFRVEDSPNCPRGEQEGFIKDVNNELILFCVVKGDADFVEDVSIGGECENGFEGGERILVEGGEIVHCQKGGVFEGEEIVEDGVEGGGDGEDIDGEVGGEIGLDDESQRRVETLSCEGLDERECVKQNSCIVKRRNTAGCTRYAGCEGAYESEIEENDYCYSDNVDGLISDSRHSAEISADYVYEDVNVIDWEFRVGGDNIEVYVPDLTVYRERIDKKIETTAETPAHGHCLYGFFPFQREARTLSYDIPFDSETFVGGRRICRYTPLPLREEINEGLIGSGVFADLYELGDNVCPDLQTGRPKSADTCLTTAGCDIQIDSGELSYYGFTFEKDSCGNRIVKEDNSGEPLSLAEISERATAF